MNLLYVLSILLTRFSCKAFAREPLCSENLTYESGVETVRQLAASKSFISAENCLRKLLTRFPNNIDLNFQLVRVLAWQKRFVEARSLLGLYAIQAPAEWYELSGDLESYQGDAEQAFIFYQLAQKKLDENNKSESLEKLSIQHKIDNALAEKNSKNINIAEKRNWNLGIAVFYQKYFQAQSLAASENGLSTNFSSSEWNTHFSINKVARTYATHTFVDYPIELGVLGKRENFFIGVNFLFTSDPIFSPLYALEILNGLDIVENIKIGIPIKYLYYIDFNPYLQITPTVNIGMQYLQFEFSHERNFQNRFIFFNKLKSILYYRKIIFDTYFGFGASEYNLPGRTHSELSKFYVLGLKCVYILNSQWQIFINGEKKSEIGFNHLMVGGGVAWKP